MKVQYISDLHFEMLSESSVEDIKSRIKPEAEVCILTGDVGDPFHRTYSKFLFYLSYIFKKVFVIAGNHEFYRNEVHKTLMKIDDVCSGFKNVSFLDNKYEDYKGYRFIGTTLWSEIKNKQYTINDTKMIKNMTVDKYISLHDECQEFLEEALDECNEKNLKAIVITHHLPIYELTHSRYRDVFYANYQQWFHANIDETIKRNSECICAWIYGHTHSKSVQTHYGVDFYCNPLGYANENDCDDINETFDVPDL